jgi:hypothetical protein
LSAPLVLALVAAIAPIRFRDVAESAGIRFVLENHPTPRKHLVETMAGGVAAFDYDGDGLVDIYFTNGASLPSLRKDSPRYWNRLYRNLGGMKFEDVTERAGVAGAGYSMAAAAADYDNDGDADLFVAGAGRNLLYRNRGGTFEEVAARAGIASGPWSIGGAWLDYNNDGRLDLFVLNYVQWSPAFDRFCGDPSGRVRVYCHPRFFDGLPNALYRNRGDGTFEDVSAQTGVAAHTGKGMGVAVADYDADGDADLFVTNDKIPNFLFRNDGGRFEEVALEAGVALADSGLPVSAMGADFRDYDNDGLPDITFAALAGETFPLFRNRGRGLFADATYQSRMGPLSRVYSGYGIGMFDFNNDGRKDIFTSNAHVNDRVALFEATGYKLPNSVFAGRGDGTFEDVSRDAGFTVARAHRGSAFADFNNDGRIDIVVASLGEPAELWENTSPGDAAWLIVRLEGKKSNRDAIGAEVRIGGQHNHMTTAVGYASSSRFGVHFGLGAQKPERVEVRWPGGGRQVVTGVPVNRVLGVTEPVR